MLHKEQETAVRKMLSTLPPDYRLPVVLRYWNDLSYEEIAEATHSTVSAVKSRLFRARAMLAQQAGQFQAARGRG
jgi:RNA polymerase sigma-70 factor (ECF subfamily)